MQVRIAVKKCHQQKISHHPGKKEQSLSSFSLVEDKRHQMAGRDVEKNACCQRHHHRDPAFLQKRLRDLKTQGPCQSSRPQPRRSPKAFFRERVTASSKEATVTPSGTLCKSMANSTDHPSRSSIQKLAKIEIPSTYE